MKKKLFLLIFIGFILFTAGFSSSYSHSSSPFLVKIDKTANITASLLQNKEIIIIQELETCYLGFVDEEHVSKLKNSGFSATVLHRLGDPGQRFFLVHLRDFSHLERLKQQGFALPVEGNNVVYLPFDGLHPLRAFPGWFRGIKELGSPVRVQSRPFSPVGPGIVADYRAVNPVITGMTSQVSKQKLQSSVLSLQNFKTRYASTSECEQAGTFLYNTLKQSGLQVSYDSFNFEGYASRNVVGYLPGDATPSSVVIICAHYDSYAGGYSESQAPGADDNASGSAAVLEAARIMSGVSFDYSIKFILFSAEEWGFYGSDHYAGSADQQGENIIAVFNMDMISYTDHLPEDLDVITNSQSYWLGAILETAAQNYSTIDVTTTRDGSYYYSDQAPFWDRGFAAVLCIEDYEDTNPYYHTRNDTLDKINLDFLTEAAKVCLAAAAQMAKPRSSTTPGITVTSPNGGESWGVGSSHAVTWTGTGTVGNVKISYTTDNGSHWSTVISSTANDGSYTWKVPNTVSSKCRVKVSEAADGSPSDSSDAVFSIVSGGGASIGLNRTSLDFCALTSGSHTGSQEVWISNNGSGSMAWLTGSNAAWLSAAPASGSNDGIITVMVNPQGLAVGAYTGKISVSAANASNSPRAISVTLKVKAASQDNPPFGEFSTPVEGSTVRGSIPVTGWVLDDVGCESVKIYRVSGGSRVFIGDAVFVEGARPDIESAYPGFPANYKAGWGYMLLTHFLPGQGNGTFTFVAKARDVAGREVSLGSKTVTVNNSAAVKPFGAIDTPAQGGRASGSAFVNFGWVLTPQPNRVPVNGSTLHVYVDGVERGSPVYNKYRSDIAGLFPGYVNSNGAGGSFYLDTTHFETGLHTIQWTAADNAGNSDGIGSRYFTVLNSGSSSASRQGTTQYAVRDAATWMHPIEPGSGPMRVRKGFDRMRALREVFPDEYGFIHIVINELERVEIHLPAGSTGSTGTASPPDRNHAPAVQLSGYQVVADRLRLLPIGSCLDKETGIFYWMPGAGFLGSYRLLFLETDKHGSVTVGNVIIDILPKFPGK